MDDEMQEYRTSDRLPHSRCPSLSAMAVQSIHRSTSSHVTTDALHVYPDHRCCQTMVCEYS